MKKAIISYAIATAIATGTLLSLGAAAPAPSSDGWQKINTGEFAQVEFKGHVLSDIRGVGAVLYCPSEADNPTFRADLSAALSGAVVDYFDPRYVTPDLALLEQYDCVMTWVNYAFGDKDAMGNVLADYVDGGGRVILGQWCLPTAGNSMGGRIMTDGYCPVTGSMYTGGTYLGDGVECATVDVNQGVNTGYCDNATLIGGNMSDGTWDNGYLFTAWRPDYLVWSAPGNTSDLYTSPAADVVQWTANMCTCGGACPEDINGDGVVDVLDLLQLLSAWGPC